MKKLFYFLLFLLIYGCNSISKQDYLANACACLKGVEDTSESLKEDVADCLRSHFTAYKRGAKYSVQEYLEQHPSATEETAQNQVVENLHQELLRSCEKYKVLHTIIDAAAREE